MVRIETFGKISEINFTEINKMAKAKTFSEIFDILSESNKRQEIEKAKNILAKYNEV